MNPERPAERPQALDMASGLLWLLVAGGLAVCVFAVLRRTDLEAQWGPLHSEDSTIRPVSFLPVVLVLYAIISLTVLILVSLLRGTQTWARYALSVVALGLVLGSFAIMRTAPPTSVRIALVVAAVLSAAVLVLLWNPAVGSYLRDARAGRAAEAAEAERLERAERVASADS